MKFLEDKVKIAVRFSEVDAMGVVWHGNYLKFFEDGRESFGNKKGLSYLDVYDKGFFTPIVKTSLQYRSPIYFGDEIEVRSRLERSKAAKIIFNYEIWNITKNILSADGSSVQVFLNKDSREMELLQPLFYREWINKMDWREE